MISQDRVLSPDDALVYVVTCAVTIPEGVTLQIEPGAVLKFATGEWSSLENRGSLLAQGTTEQPVTFTSIHDDSVAGDTNGNGRQTRPDRLDWQRNWRGITVQPGGRAVFDHAVVAWARSGIQVERSELRFRRSTLRDSGSGIQTIGNTATTGPPRPFVVTSSRFARLNHAVLFAPGQGNPAAPRIQNNIAINTGAWWAFDVRGRLDVNLLSGNRAIGGQRPAMQINGTIRNDGTFTTSLPLVIDGNLTIPAGVTATAPAATVIKFAPGDGESLRVDGSLLVTGTAERPATFTSIHDDTVAGDTNGNEAQTQPRAGDWRGVHATAGSVIDADHLHLAYGGIRFEGDRARLNQIKFFDGPTGLEVWHGKVAFRGSFTRMARAINACQWGTDCAVDASFSYWGDAEGPLGPSGDGGYRACGAIRADPWLPAPDSAETAVAGYMKLPNCSGENTTPLEDIRDGQEQAQTYLNHLGFECNAGEDDACDAIDDYNRCFTEGWGAVEEAAREYAGAGTGPAEDVAEETIDEVVDLMESPSRTLRSVVSLLDVASLVDDVIGTARLFVDLYQIYQSCIGYRDGEF